MCVRARACVCVCVCVCDHILWDSSATELLRIPIACTSYSAKSRTHVAGVLGADGGDRGPFSARMVRSYDSAETVFGSRSIPGNDIRYMRPLLHVTDKLFVQILVTLLPQPTQLSQADNDDFFAVREFFNLVRRRFSSPQWPRRQVENSSSIWSGARSGQSGHTLMRPNRNSFIYRYPSRFQVLYHC